MAFEHIVTVRLYEIDRAGIVFFGRFFEYCHATLEELMAQAFGDFEACFQTDWRMPLVHTEADFKRPVRLGERLRVSLDIERLGERSVTCRYHVHGADDGQLRAIVRLVHCFIDARTFTSVDAPEDFIDALRRFHLLPQT